MVLSQYSFVTKEMFTRDGLHVGGPGHYGTFPIQVCDEGDAHEGWLARWWPMILWYFPNTKEKFVRDGLHLSGLGQ